MRLTRRVFHDLAIWMVAFGLLIGVALERAWISSGTDSVWP